MGMNGRLLRPKVSGFTPRQIPDLAAWWDAADSASITVQTGVQQWADKSGNGRNLVQNTTNNQPLHGSVTLNGKPVVTFDGTNDSMGCSFTLNQPFACFFVYRYEASPATAKVVLTMRFAGGSRCGEFQSSSSSAMSLFSGASLFLSNVGAAMTAFNVWDYEQNSTSSAIRLRKTGATSSGNAGANNGNGFSLAADGGASQSSFANVSVAEVCVYSRALAVSEADAVRKYLGTKWNLAYLS
jgi:hypothetical protein